MDIKLAKGDYILAVSGGVDSMVLLNILSKKARNELIVAHFNHGIRPDSYKDEALVKKSAGKHGHKFEVGHGNLGPNTSEERARDARYKFLTTVRNKHKAEAIITAHHQDDLVETAFINMLRGTGRRGITAISFNPKVLRPLLKYQKKDIIAYAENHGLSWIEDGTNMNNSYLRNYIRANLIPNLSIEKRSIFLKNLDNIAKINQEINQLIATLSQKIINDKGFISRSAFINLPTEVGKELIMHWLAQYELRNYDRKTIARINNAIRVAPPGTSHEVTKGMRIIMKSSSAHFSNT